MRSTLIVLTLALTSSVAYAYTHDARSLKIKFFFSASEKEKESELQSARRLFLLVWGAQKTLYTLFAGLPGMYVIADRFLLGPHPFFYFFLFLLCIVRHSRMTAEAAHTHKDKRLKLTSAVEREAESIAPFRDVTARAKLRAPARSRRQKNTGSVLMVPHHQRAPSQQRQLRNGSLPPVWPIPAEGRPSERYIDASMQTARTNCAEGFGGAP